ncbi:Class E basic helix-loop-helix protein 40 [Oryzias melastigma]|uniref:Basic helix-loop-helix family member e40 n=2 Tax=Oryzias melastigma TaxID=30732 RepID=A0A3B3E2F9_ORYME|nr:class E basic helix-loop-helix protein 40 [Oryzias melastigma]KAF6722748.1 Class E basic helix-loop-helix protein 40 [Oryzias melastigma]
MERIPSVQPPPLSKLQTDLSDMQSMDFPMYVYKPRRGMKRGEESKDTYKLPHRLIEKKRRDRINECIAQLKDLLPEHLKLTTLGHLEKAVVLELTLKHVKTLTSLLEQQQQKILALQSGMQIEQPPVNQEKSEEMFRSGFHMCAKEILHYLAAHESSGDFTPSHVVNHLHKVAAEVLQGPARPRTPVSPGPSEVPAYHQHDLHKEKPDNLPPKPSEGYGKNCVPVIQRAYAPPSGEQSGSDTDTDSGYGGELEKPESRVQHQEYYGPENPQKRSQADRQNSSIKQEDDEPRHKRPRVESSEDELLSGGESSTSSSSSGYSSYMSVSPNHPPPPPHPLCMPFYLIPPSAAAYLPMLEKCWYPGAVPMLYPGMGGSSPTMPSDRPSPPQLVLSPRGGSPAPTLSQTPMDSPALLQALKQVPPLNLETKE